jgi:Tol biopolymer transport system component
MMMRKSGFWLFVLLSVAAIAVSIFGASMLAQEEALLLFTRRDGDAIRAYLFNPEAGEERVLADLANWGDLGWSPDGRFVWVVDTPDEVQRRLRLFELETGEERTISESLNNNYCYPSLIWSPDAQRLAYFTETENNLGMTVLHLPTESSYTIPVVAGQAGASIFWSPDGSYIFLSNYYTDLGHRLVSSADGSEVLILPENLSSNVVFSPDKRFLASRDEQAIWLYELETANSIQLEANTNYLQWSANGTYLAGLEYGLSESLFYYNTESRTEHRAEFDYPVRFAAWTADETVILVYADYEDRLGDALPQSLRSYNLETGEIKTIMETSGWLGKVSQSGDWLLVYYDSVLPEPGQLGSPRELQIFNSMTLIATDRTGEELGLWRTREAYPENIFIFADWQDGNHEISLLYCGSG